MKAGAHPTACAWAFTLVELLAAIAIVIVLAGLAVPVALRSVESAKDRGCVSRMRQVAVAARLYAMDNDGAFPRAIPGSTRWEERMDVRLGPYLGGAPMYWTTMRCWRKSSWGGVKYFSVYGETWIILDRHPGRWISLDAERVRLSVTPR